ncbi:2-haloalkanoic acid dehalogenase [Pseudomassariella vexata]|uniref:2-haloalkanoic acid dehalogenase n=1 Tax=Pseudomassariella vexata TaxID=1141098 RepID=A0A1Y2EAR6_9PEZI|nr:2-haloalkanoic acid dehalogenase [Pseudomassariella vexata]ORY68659.1 2-haloalkanoic acid dehalogenase [Pseudomassariella vexata]
MARRGKHVVFDIVGTCVSYDNFFSAIESRLGDRLRAEGIKPKLFGFAWMECAEREFAYLDLSGRYVPFWSTFQPLFHRILWMAGVEDPRAFATDDDALFMVQAYRQLKARPGINECWEKLRDAGFTVWALTTGDKERVKGYLDSNGIEISDDNFVSCNDIPVRKPHPDSYKYLLDKFEGAEETWFAAAHMWDASAAKHNGFKAAWCSVYEKEPVSQVFGDVDVTADSLVEMAEKIIQASGR